MSDNMTILLVVALIFVVALMAYWMLKFYNSPDAERYRKRRVQGPFVPLSEADLAEDEARIDAHRK